MTDHVEAQIDQGSKTLWWRGAGFMLPLAFVLGWIARSFLG